MKKILTLSLTGLLACGAVLATPAAAQAAPKHYASCAAVHRAYSGGIAKPGVNRNTVKSHGVKTYRALGGKVKHSKALYNANKKLDRDKDGVACEV